MAEGKRQRKESHSEAPEFDQRIIEVSRVTRVMAGGKRMRFRACVVVGDRKGRIGFGLGKGADVALAVNKAVTRAKKNLIHLPLFDNTIPHAVRVKVKAARLLLKPAPEGTGIMAGGAIRSSLEVSGVGNIVAKVFGSKNKVNNVRALFAAFETLSDSASLKKNLLEKRTLKKNDASEKKKNESKSEQNSSH